jgi:hypothetical protein
MITAPNSCTASKQSVKLQTFMRLERAGDQCKLPHTGSGSVATRIGLVCDLDAFTAGLVPRAALHQNSASYWTSDDVSHFLTV